MSDLQESKPNTIQNTELKGLDGWLILVGISVILTPIRLLPNFFSEAELIWTSVSWAFLFDPAVESIVRLTSYLLIFEFTYGAILMGLLLVQIYLFFTKHKKFPRFFIAILILFLIFKPIDSFFISYLYPTESIFNAEAIFSYLYNSIYAMIWIPYMLRSKRVKNTFVFQAMTQSKV
jgi:hypothetical protein